MSDETDLYGVLGIDSSASKEDIKKAYHRAARTYHPDKATPEEQETATARFKSIKAAYEILYDEEKRHLYDTHGMSAFDPASGPGGMHGGVDLDDILAQMFGMNMGDTPNASTGSQRKGGRGLSEEQEYEVSLEELYKGKTTKFASTKNIICPNCKGSGGKEKAKPHNCSSCNGKGMTTRLRSVGPGLVTNETVPCGTCNGAGQIFKDKDRCKKCKGKRVVQQKKMLELYIPPGSSHGDRIVLSGEADQVPGREPGDLVFELEEQPHDVFERSGASLRANLHISLVEALTGFNRVVLKHLDDRGIQLQVPTSKGMVLRPGQVLRVPNEGMPIKRSENKGDLFLEVIVDFPEDGWLKDEATVAKLRGLLPKPRASISADIIDEVDFEVKDNLDDFRASSEESAAWEDVDEGTAQCPTQ